MEVTAKLDCIGKFINREGEKQDANRVHYIIGTGNDIVLGGFYLPVGTVFPKEGILVKLKE